MARRLALIVPFAVIVGALLVRYTADFGLAFQAGVEAWNTGHPQRLLTWTGTPFYAFVMALVTRISPLKWAALEFMVLNLVVWAALLHYVWDRLRGLVSPRFWFATYMLGIVFAPAIQTIFWLQPNLIVFALALLGFAMLGRRNLAGAALIGVSVAVKPIVVLLPLALLLRGKTRMAGVWAIAATTLLSFTGLAFLAWRAGDAAVLNPVDYLQGFLSKGRGPIAACVPENYSPVALLCRLGVEPTVGTTIAVAVVVLIAWWFMTRMLSETPESEWAIFAAACIYSGLLGPIAWASYGVLMAPLFLLLAYQLWRESAPAPFWIGLGFALLLAELVWDPLESLARTPVPVVVFSYTAGQFSQYVLLFVWARWRVWRRVSANNRTSSMSPSVQRP